MRCPDCNKMVDDGAKYCPFCGAPLAINVSGVPVEKTEGSRGKALVVTASVISSVLALVFLYIFGLMCVGISETMGEWSKEAFELSFNHATVYLFLSVIIGFAGNLSIGFRGKGDTKIPYFILCGIQIVLITAILEIFPYKTPVAVFGSYTIVSLSRIWGFCVGIGSPLLQSAFLMCFSRDTKLIKAVFKVFIFAIAFLIISLILALVGVCNLEMGVAGIGLSTAGSVLVFVCSFILNRRNHI